MLRKYYDSTKPGIIKGNLITAAAGFFAGSIGHVSLTKLLFVLCGIALVIASGCVFNNILDRSIDMQMKRTKNRSIANGTIPLKNAVLFGVILGLVGFIVLLLSANILTVWIGIVGLFSYVVLYGFVKRKSYFGTEAGTISGATPILAGYTAANGSIDLFALCLFAVMVIWQMPHFYAIAIFRKTEYKNAGIPLVSIVKGALYTKLSLRYYILAFPVVAMLPAILGFTSLIYILLVGLVALYWMVVATRNPTNHEIIPWSKKIFGISLIVLLIFSTGIILDSLMRNSLVL